MTSGFNGGREPRDIRRVARLEAPTRDHGAVRRDPDERQVVPAHERHRAPHAGRVTGEVDTLASRRIGDHDDVRRRRVDAAAGRTHHAADVPPGIAELKTLQR